MDAIDDILKQSTGNIGHLEINLARDTNSFEVLTAKKLIITKSGFDILVNRMRLETNNEAKE
jgi:hypothetical protein